jgi:hypothetical protein
MCNQKHKTQMGKEEAENESKFLFLRIHILSSLNQNFSRHQMGMNEIQL